MGSIFDKINRHPRVVVIPWPVLRKRIVSLSSFPISLLSKVLTVVNYFSSFVKTFFLPIARKINGYKHDTTIFIIIVNYFWWDNEC